MVAWALGSMLILIHPPHLLSSRSHLLFVTFCSKLGSAPLLAIIITHNHVLHHLHPQCHTDAGKTQELSILFWRETLFLSFSLSLLHHLFLFLILSFRLPILLQCKKYVKICKSFISSKWFLFFQIWEWTFLAMRSTGGSGVTPRYVIFLFFLILLPSFPPSLLPSFPPSLLPSFPPSLLPSFPPSSLLPSSLLLPPPSSLLPPPSSFPSLYLFFFFSFFLSSFIHSITYTCF